MLSELFATPSPATSSLIVMSILPEDGTVAVVVTSGCPEEVAPKVTGSWDKANAPAATFIPSRRLMEAPPPSLLSLI
jgi:hypothetical protein